LLLELPLNKAVPHYNILLAVPFEAIKLYISLQASVTSASDIGLSLKEGQKGKFFVFLPTAYTAAKSVLCCQTHLNHG
jgi:hypothetical protein